MHRSQLLVVLSLSVLFSTLVAAQAAEYTFTTFDVPGAPHTLAWGINDSGQIVGGFYDGTRSHGLLIDGTTFTTIDVPGARNTFAYGINKIRARLSGSSTMVLVQGPMAFSPPQID
jgi:uncharacterized membrane protein